MDEQNWQQISDLYALAIEKPANDRETFVKSLSKDAAITDAVLRLITAHDIRTNFMATGEGISESLVSLPAGHKIGPWSVVDELGAGGMGEVYLVERADGHFEKQAALKLISSSSPASWRRFAQERQILADLEHPNIARLIDGGVAEDGRPFLVMEHIEGQDLLSYAAKNSLSTNDRLKLFTKLLSAVSFAHERLILHRDLKPTNCLVTARGDIKLLDFGVAGLADQENDPATPMTKPYASPEQLEGKKVTIRSDIFSLGITLHLLLLGSLPKRKNNGVASTKNSLNPELNAIITKATATQPGERYPSVEALSRDIQNYLTHQPISALKQSRVYTLKKFLIRNKISASLSGAVALSLIAGIIGTSSMAASANRASAQSQIDAQIADERSIIAEATSQIYADITAKAYTAQEEGTLDFPAILDEQRKTAIDALKTNPQDARNRLYALSKLHDLRGDVAALEATVKPIYEAEDIKGRATHMSLQRYAMIKGRQQDLETAFAAFDRAEKLMLLEPDQYAFDLANMRANRAGFSDDPELIGETTEQIKATAEELIANGGSLNDAVHLYSQTGFLLFQRDELEEALANMWRAYEINQMIEGTRGTSDEQLLYPQVVILSKLKEYKRAKPIAREVVALAKEAYGPSVWEARRQEDYAKVLIGLQEYTSAISALQRAVELFDEYDAKPSRGFAESLEMLASAYEAANLSINALDTYKRALAAFEELPGDREATKNAIREKITALESTI